MEIVDIGGKIALPQLQAVYEIRQLWTLAEKLSGRLKIHVSAVHPNNSLGLPPFWWVTISLGRSEDSAYNTVAPARFA
jgi:hypothetical protein